VVLLAVFVLSASAVPSGANEATPAGDARHVYWEDLTERQKDAVLGAGGVSRDAIEFYRGRLRPSDDERTFALLDALTASGVEDPSIRAFYFFTFNRICATADGALAEVLGPHCERTVLDRPAYVINYFRTHKDVLDKYAISLGPEFKFYADGTSDMRHGFEEFRAILSERLAADKDLRAALVDFLAEIEKYMRSTN
jgi:hypothetical protein